jgi:hypothetical protein
MAARSQLVQAQAAEQAMMSGQPTPEMQAQQQQIAQGAQGMEQGKQQMAITQAGEERAAADHAVGMSERVMTSIGGDQQGKKPVKKILVRPVRR